MESKFHELILPQEKVPDIDTSDAFIVGKVVNFDVKDYDGNENFLMTTEFENVSCKLLAITKESMYIFTVEMWRQSTKGADNIMPIVCDQKEEFIRYIIHFFSQLF